MEKLKMATKSLIQENIEKLAEIFPGVVTEARDEKGNLIKVVDFELLKQELSDRVVEGDRERYQLTWPGKKEAVLLANMPINKTLRPVKEESVDWENTGNLYIEGNNLEALKILQESYLNKIKCIYIDPPYNTGKDFIYRDNFKQSKEEYLADSGQVDGDGNRLFQNTESNGRFHSDWLSMMYPRLKLARNLLREDGVIFISIDDNEVHNLRKICDEIFGEGNFVAALVWEGALKNDSRFVSISHDYIYCYAKDKFCLKVNGTIWRTRKEGIDAIYKQVEELKSIHKDDYESITNSLREWYSSLSKNHPAWQHRHYNKVDSRGVYFPSDISWPGGGGPKYPIRHPITGGLVRVPARGWVFPTPERMQQAIDEGRVDFGEDETKVPTLKRYLHETEGQVLPSVMYKDRRSAMQRLRQIMGGNVFDNPKDEKVLMKLFEATTNGNDIILDFFSGSATTAHAVMQLNAEDGGNRKYIMVQLPEPCPEDSEAYKAGFKNISEIGKERIRRAAKKIKEETGADIDYGFRVFKVDSSNMKDVYYRPDEFSQQDLFGMVSNIKEDRTGEDLLIQVMLEWGLELSLPMEKRNILGKEVHFVAGNSLVACFEEGVTEDLVREIAKERPLRVVFRDSSFADDAARINVEELFKMLSPSTEIKVI
ncbi:hypothetical protein H0A61_01829 [Koleobacter methoxysyntrophicus]|uniref:DNA methylase N-4/N-6 domain-containing protein n=1 Tax=Koleobacter methoxysyntrophicus TaxID=2751313 RepID=A0A8A0RQJ5_9FIRM|nr:site-specific DNA-methyltransferase [Koleobacter methoxysyntrophicus]QSQ09466.1 hypothetical protein H0A61_01829 [Koleobacter methoxysyntrophicus]